MTYSTNVHTPAPAVRDDGAVYTASGMRIAPAEVRAREVADQAGRWLAFATDRTRMTPRTLTAKALQSTAFSVLRGASSLAVPSKLVGTSGHQRALWGLVRDPAKPWAALALEATGDGVTAGHGDEALGELQPKHLGWVRPLLPFGLTVHLGRVTGHDYDGYSLGCNVVFGRVGTALDGLLAALGSGDGGRDAPPRTVAPGTDGVEAGRGPRTGPPTGTAPLRLVTASAVEVRPEGDAVRLGADPDDVVLYRRVDGTARASVPHAVRHSPSGLEWGYGGSGPADLARSVLLALTDDETAEALYQAFKAAVVACVPYAGGVLRAADVRAWVAAESDPAPAA